MFANVKFSDVFAFENGGIFPAVTGIAVGTTSGAAVPLVGPGQGRKLAFLLTGTSGSASGTVNFYLATATASNGAFTSISQTSPSALVSVSLASQYTLLLDTRNEAFADLGTAPTWVKPVVVVAGAAQPFQLLALHYLLGSQPASLYNAAAGQIVSEVDFY